MWLGVKAIFIHLKMIRSIYKTDSICLISFSGGSKGDGAVSIISGKSSSFSSSISSSIGVNVSNITGRVCNNRIINAIKFCQVQTHVGCYIIILQFIKFIKIYNLLFYKIILIKKKELVYKLYNTCGVVHRFIAGAMKLVTVLTRKKNPAMKNGML